MVNMRPWGTLVIKRRLKRKLCILRFFSTENIFTFCQFSLEYIGWFIIFNTYAFKDVHAIFFFIKLYTLFIWTSINLPARYKTTKRCLYTSFVRALVFRNTIYHHKHVHTHTCVLLSNKGQKLSPLHVCIMTWVDLLNICRWWG